MASLPYYPVLVLFMLLIFSSISVGSRGRTEGVKEMKPVLGSRPPKCVNRCWNCRPCVAALVAPPHHKTTSFSKGDESYYLLAWKCKCGDKYYQP